MHNLLEKLKIINLLCLLVLRFFCDLLLIVLILCSDTFFFDGAYTFQSILQITRNRQKKYPSPKEINSLCLISTTRFLYCRHL